MFLWGKCVLFLKEKTICTLYFSKHCENSPFLILFQLCIEILDSLKEGKFGPEGVAAAADYQKKCALHFNMSSIFSESSEVNTSSHLNNNGNTAETDSTSEALSKMAISGSSPQLKTESTAVTSASWKEKTILLVHFCFSKTLTPQKQLCIEQIYLLPSRNELVFRRNLWLALPSVLIISLGLTLSCWVILNRAQYQKA